MALISFIWILFLSSFQNRTWAYFCWHCIFFYWKKKKKTCYTQQFIRLEMSKNKKYTNIILLETSLILHKSWNDSMCWGRKGSNHSITDYASVWLFSETFFWMCIQKTSGTKPPRNYCLFSVRKEKQMTCRRHFLKPIYSYIASIDLRLFIVFSVNWLQAGEEKLLRL